LIFCPLATPFLLIFSFTVSCRAFVAVSHGFDSTPGDQCPPSHPFAEAFGLTPFNPSPNIRSCFLLAPCGLTGAVCSSFCLFLFFLDNFLLLFPSYRPTLDFDLCYCDCSFNIFSFSELYAFPPLQDHDATRFVAMEVKRLLVTFSRRVALPTPIFCTLYNFFA